MGTLKSAAAALAVLAAIIALATACSTSRQPLHGDGDAQTKQHDGMLQFPDGAGAKDVWLPTGDGFTTGGITVEGELCGGSEVASGGGLILQGQLGHAFETGATSGGGTTLQWNSALLP